MINTLSLRPRAKREESNPEKKLQNMGLLRRYTPRNDVRGHFARFVSFFSIFFFLFVSIAPAFAAIVLPPTVKNCKVQIQSTFEQIIGIQKDAVISGYIQKLDDLFSTKIPTTHLLDEVAQMVRDARVEVFGICGEVGKFARMNEFYETVYSISACRGLLNIDAASQLEVVNFCSNAAEKNLDVLMENLAEFLTKKAIQTSLIPITERMRSLNGRLMTLLSEYSRLVNNFFTFSFRLGDTIIGERD